MQKESRTQTKASEFSWELRLGNSEDVDETIGQLSDDLDEKEREKRRRKLNLYTREPDRDVILAVNKDQILGYLTIVEYDEPRPDIPNDVAEC